jgi:hypothetical protein
MTLPRMVECAIRLERGAKGSHRLNPGVTTVDAPLPPGRVPRLARLLALAHKCDGLLRQGAIADYAALARLGHVSRARITQIMNLLYLAPDIQEEILYLSPTRRGRDPIHLRQLQAIACILDWPEQRARWCKLGRTGAPGRPRLALGNPWVTPSVLTRLARPKNIPVSWREFPGGSSPAEVTDWGSPSKPSRTFTLPGARRAGGTLFEKLGNGGKHRKGIRWPSLKI